MAIRLAAGAGRRRLVRYLLTETAVLFLAGGVAATIVAPWFIAVTSVLSVPSHLIRPDLLNFGLELDTRTLLFTMFLSSVTAIIFGLAPATQSSRIDLFSELKATEASSRIRYGRWRHRLVIVQVALSFALLVTAGLSIRTLGDRLAQDSGFDPANVGTMSVDVATQGYDETRGTLFLRQLLRRIETAPGIESATLAQFSPAADSYSGTSIRKNNEERIQIEVNSVGPGYFETVRIPLIRGRDFRWTDDQDSRQVAIISQPVAERFWPNADPIWETDLFQLRTLGSRRSRRRDPAPAGWEAARIPMCTFPYSSDIRELSPPWLDRDNSRLPPRLPRCAKPSTSWTPICQPTDRLPCRTTIAESVAPWLRVNFLLGSFGLLALILVSVGLYGVLSHSIIRRTARSQFGRQWEQHGTTRFG